MLIKHPYFDPGTGANGGGTPPPAAGGNGSGGAGTPPASGATDPEAVEFETLSGIGEEKLDATQKTRYEALKGKYNVEVVGEDGKPITGDALKAYQENEKKFNLISAKAEDQRTPEEVQWLKDNSVSSEEKSLYQQVDEELGNEYSIDYGDVEPESVEGVILRENFIAEHALKTFEEAVKTKHPRAYQYLLHVSNGGKDEDFFRLEAEDYSKVTVTKEDASTQEKVLRKALALKGNSPDDIDLIVKGVKDSLKLFERSKEELEALQAGQKQRNQARETQEQQRKQKRETAMGNLADVVETSIEKGFEGIAVPQKDRKAFATFFGDRVDFDDATGTFYSTVALNPKEIAKALKVAYFEFKGGNFKDLIERSAKSQNALKFKTQMKKTVVAKAAGGSKNRTFIPLGDM